MSDLSLSTVLATDDRTPPGVAEVPCDTSGASVVDSLRRCGAARPDAPAVVAEGEAVTYGDLVERAERLAGQLVASDAGRDHIVALYLPRGADLIVAACAVLMSGAAYLALDPEHPVAWSRRLVARSGARVVLASPDGAASLSAPGVAVIDPAVPLGPSPAAPLGYGPVGEPFVDPAAAAYLAYTSGSTGEPRGVLVEHGGLANLVRWYGEQYQISPADRMTQLARPSFDAFALEVWPCLSHGATLYVTPQRLLASPTELVGWLRSRAITVSFVPTPLAMELFDVPWPDPASVRLRAMLLGGDRLSRWPPPDLPFRVFNNYGPTEATVVATCGGVPADGHRDGLPSIGLPLPGVTVDVVGDDGDPVGCDQPGELVIRGVGVARGYIDDCGGGPVTIAHPFVDSSGERAYPTGDLVRRSADGQVHYLGRRDEQLKINGIRVSPGDVEAALQAQSAVRAAAVVGHRPEPDSPVVLVAYVTLDKTATAASVSRERLAEELPAAMVPTVIVPVDALPLTAHGKVDRRELALRQLPPAPADSPFATDTEAMVADLWREVLSTAEFGAHSDFFDIGGDSLRVLRLVNKAKARGLRLLPDDVYQHPVLRDLAAEIQDRRPQANPRTTEEQR